MRTLSLSPVVILLAAVSLTACGPRECELGGGGDPCDEGLVCEESSGEELGRCRAPVVITGQVRDERTDEPVAGAVIVATTESGAPVGPHAVSSATGTFEVRVPSRRGENGVPESRTLRLNAGAADYLALPGGLRDAVWVTTPGADAGTPDEGYQVPVTVELTPLPAALQGGARVSGTVEPAPSGTSVLVVAERGGTGDGFAGFSDVNGAYTIFNVTPDSYEVHGYARGANYTPKVLEVSTLTATADLELSSVPAATVEGQVNLLAAAGNRTAAAGPTRLALVPLSVALAASERGIIPFGLTLEGVDGAFSVEGVPNGAYGIWVGTPGEGNSARDLTNLTVTVTNGAPNRSVTINVVGSVEQREPLEEGGVAQAGVRPIYGWTPYPGADGYVVSVFDVFGRQARDPQLVISGSAASVLADADLPPGRYQWRVQAFEGFLSEISRSDPDQGHFVVP